MIARCRTPGSALGLRTVDQGRRHGHRRGADRIPAGLEHRAPDPRRLAARLHRREGQGVRDRDPDRRDLRRHPRLLAAHPRHRRSASARSRGRSASRSTWPIAFVPAVVLGLLFGKAIKAHLFTPLVVATTFIVGGFIILWAERRPASTVRIDERRRHAPARRARRSAWCSAWRWCRARAAPARRSSAACCSACRARRRPSSASSSRSRP